MINIDNLIRILQASIAPCVLISGLGLLLLSMVNRLARPIDRIRLLCEDLKGAPREDVPILKEQILILYKRCQLLRNSIALMILSIFFVSIIILLLFLIFIFSIPLQFLVELLFTLSMISLIIALLFFLLDIRFTLKSIKMEIDKHIKGSLWPYLTLSI